MAGLRQDHSDSQQNFNSEINELINKCKLDLSTSNVYCDEGRNSQAELAHGKNQNENQSLKLWSFGKRTSQKTISYKEQQSFSNKEAELTLGSARMNAQFVPRALVSDAQDKSPERLKSGGDRSRNHSPLDLDGDQQLMFKLSDQSQIKTLGESDAVFIFRSSPAISSAEHNIGHSSRLNVLKNRKSSSGQVSSLRNTPSRPQSTAKNTERKPNLVKGLEIVKEIGSERKETDNSIIDQQNMHTSHSTNWLDKTKDFLKHI